MLEPLDPERTTFEGDLADAQRPLRSLLGQVGPSLLMSHEYPGAQFLCADYTSGALPLQAHDLDRMNIAFNGIGLHQIPTGWRLTVRSGMAVMAFVPTFLAERGVISAQTLYLEGTHVMLVSLYTLGMGPVNFRQGMPILGLVAYARKD